MDDVNDRDFDNVFDQPEQEFVEPDETDRRPSKRRRIEENEEQSIYNDGEVDPDARDADLTLEDFLAARKALLEMEPNSRDHRDAMVVNRTEARRAKQLANPSTALWNAWLASQKPLSAFLEDPFKCLSTGSIDKWIKDMDEPVADEIVEYIRTKAGDFWNNMRFKLNKMIVDFLWSTSAANIRQDLQEQGVDFFSNVDGRDVVRAIATTFRNVKMPNSLGMPSKSLVRFVKTRLFVARGATSQKEAKTLIGMALSEEKTIELYGIPPQFVENDAGHLVAIGARAKVPPPKRAQPKGPKGKQGIERVAPVKKAGTPLPAVPAKQPPKTTSVAQGKGLVSGTKQGSKPTTGNTKAKTNNNAEHERQQFTPLPTVTRGKDQTKVPSVPGAEHDTHTPRATTNKPSDHAVVTSKSSKGGQGKPSLVSGARQGDDRDKGEQPDIFTRIQAWLGPLASRVEQDTTSVQQGDKDTNEQQDSITKVRAVQAAKKKPSKPDDSNTNAKAQKELPTSSSGAVKSGSQPKPVPLITNRQDLEVTVHDDEDVDPDNLMAPPIIKYSLQLRDRSTINKSRRAKDSDSDD